MPERPLNQAAGGRRLTWPGSKAGDQVEAFDGELAGGQVAWPADELERLASAAQSRWTNAAAFSRRISAAVVGPGAVECSSHDRQVVGAASSQVSAVFVPGVQRVGSD